MCNIPVRRARPQQLPIYCTASIARSADGGHAWQTYATLEPELFLPGLGSASGASPYRPPGHLQ